MKAIVGRKMGMTEVFAEDGTMYPVSVVEVLPNVVTQVKTLEKDGYVAHNAHNYGNFLWGAAAKALGVPESVAKAGAHIHNLFLSHEYKGALDSKDDQHSISIGYNWK